MAVVTHSIGPIARLTADFRLHCRAKALSREERGRARSGIPWAQENGAIDDIRSGAGLEIGATLCRRRRLECCEQFAIGKLSSPSTVKISSLSSY